ncbi:IS66 family transposase [Candidatus Magnetobacterium casense]|uniref:IS66 family transposase n=1 Tax=Candidatus Magnetobacterium casense TaxID=1455061 RepID=A0ABS6S379_9BACT|nr:IS66 family transposase [Candidatus Magnetobacterium casensis]MBV6343045.1 IS66 family transposase [Candidatus Magnetobacterium casensis]
MSISFIGNAMIEPPFLPSDVGKLKAIIGLQIQEIQKYQTQVQTFQTQVQTFETQICTIEERLQSKVHEVRSRDEQLQRQGDTVKVLESENTLLREALRLARMARFAARSEKLPSNQCELFNEAELAAMLKKGEESGTEAPQSWIIVPEHTRERPKRRPLPDHLPREEVVIDLSEGEKICPRDGATLKEIGVEVSEQLDVIPAQMKVIRTIRKKYACPCCEETIRTADLPKKILPKSNATPGLLAHIAVSKYVDALPLYRLEHMFKRADIDLPRNTMAGWMIWLSEELQPVYNLMEEALLSSGYVCCDETRVQVLKEAGRKPQSLSYMWVRARHGPGIRPIILFDYDPTRSGEVPKRLLVDFKGYLQVDGYVGYDKVCLDAGITRVGCMAHVRRGFFDAYKAGGKKEGPALQVLLLIKGLYGIEEKIKGKDSIEERKRIRQEESRPILDQIKAWLDENQFKHVPQGLMGKAISYARNQWSYVIRYLEDGVLAIDNNFVENRIRPFAVGRKNWLFSDTVAGARASGMIYSILQTARGNGLEPYAYMRHLLTELPWATTVNEIEQLLPHTIDPTILNKTFPR